MISTDAGSTAPVTNWASIVGRWSFDGAKVRYSGPTGDDATVGIALSDVRLRDGIVNANITLDTDEIRDSSAGVILGYDGIDSRYVMAQLGGFKRAYSIGERDPNYGWRPIVRQGAIENLQPRRPYHLEIVQRGQKLIFSVDDVRIFEHVLAGPLSGNQIGLFAWGRNESVFENVSVQATRPRLFVAMQFSEPFETLYRKVIEPLADKKQFDVVRIDDVARPGIIFQDIQHEISEAKAIVAEITAPNSNVFYELGYAHALNKPTILLAQRDKELPFDIRSYRVIFYDDTIGGKPALEETLEKHLSAILQEV